VVVAPRIHQVTNRVLEVLVVAEMQTTLLKVVMEPLIQAAAVVVQKEVVDFIQVAMEDLE